MRNRRSVTLLFVVSSVYTSIASSLGELFDRAENLEIPDYGCKIRTSIGFNPFDIIARFEGIRCSIHCWFICYKYQSCHSVTHLADADLCLLHDTALANEGKLAHFMFKSTYYTVLLCKHPIEFERAISSGPYRGCGVGLSPVATSQNQPKLKRIIGDQAASAAPYSIPWFGVMYYGDVRHCGVSLIAMSDLDTSTWFGITAAHCFYIYEFVRTSDLEVWFGRPDMRFLTPHAVRVEIRKLKPLRGHCPNKNDIALVEFSSSITFNQYVAPLCLSRSDVDPNTEFDETCHMCGFGAIDLEARYIPEGVPRCIDTRVIRNRFTDADAMKQLNRKNVALGYCPGLKAGSGLGDSGGPVFCLQNDGRYSIIAVIVKYRIVRGIQENVYEFLPTRFDWINETMHKLWSKIRANG